jgi:hypothetical protein
MTFCTACESDDCTCPKDTPPEPLRQLLEECRERLILCNVEVQDWTRFYNNRVISRIEEVLK